VSKDSHTLQQIADFYAAYAACIDDGRLQEWPDFFSEDAWYRVVSRENHDRDLPLSTLSLKGRPMMKDRIYGVESTIFHAPYYQRHVLSLPRIVDHQDGTFDVEMNYCVFRIKRDFAADIFSVGRYLDRLIEFDGKLYFSQKFCIFDNDTIPNSLIYPI
jgi:salicylate 5-hydroxylase small subunit